jgi:hypothetical protein
MAESTPADTTQPELQIGTNEDEPPGHVTIDVALVDLNIFEINE